MTRSWQQPVLSVYRTRLLEPTGHLVGSLQLQGVRKGLRHSGVLGIGCWSLHGCLKCRADGAPKGGGLSCRSWP